MDWTVIVIMISQDCAQYTEHVQDKDDNTPLETTSRISATDDVPTAKREIFVLIGINSTIGLNIPQKEMK